MTITFVSNYINHHQIPLSNALYELLGEEYVFIQTEPMEEERKKMGWAGDFSRLPYLHLYYQESELCQDIIDKSDVVLFGGVEDEKYISQRLRDGKIIIRYSERLYREGQWKAVSPRGLIRKYLDHVRYRKSPSYLLCAGAYVASDFGLIHSYPHKKFKWGYFPEMNNYDLDKLMSEKNSDPVEILWAGRFLTLKHPEYPVLLAVRLRDKGIPFSMTMIGDGELHDEICRVIKEKNLGEYVTLTGFLSPDEVRARMEKASVFLFTSDYREGWGAVINESMNSGCAVVANCAVGAAPTLIQDGYNGFIYQNRNFEEFASLAEELVCSEEKRDRIGRAAYQTICDAWNEKEAAKRLVKLCENICEGSFSFEKEGPLSEAKAIAPFRMYKVTKKEGRKEGNE